MQHDNHLTPHLPPPSPPSSSSTSGDGSGDACWERTESVAQVNLEDLHPELRSRVRAAASNADYLLIERTEGAPDEYRVSALSGDRVVLMQLALRDNGSVAEETSTFLARETTIVELRSDVALVEATVGGSVRPFSLPVPLGERMMTLRDG